MARHLLMDEDGFDEPREALAQRFLLEGLSLHIDPFIRLWEHHFDAFVSGYANGFLKRGTILYKPGHVRIPAARELPVYESNDFRVGKNPRGIVIIDYAVACTLPEIALDELHDDGFVGKEDLLWQMTQMEGRYYNDLIPSKLVSYYHFKSYVANPSEQKVRTLLETLDIGR